MIDRTLSVSELERWTLATGLETHTLADTWSVCPVDTFQAGGYTDSEQEWRSITVPGHWQQHPDLAHYAGRVVYRCCFGSPPDTLLQARRIWLRFNGIFYWSQPYLNGTALGQHAGYFVPSEYEVTHLLRQGDDNVALVEVACPDEPNKQRKRMVTGIFSHWNGADPLINPGGIWQPVELVFSGAVRVQSVRCHSESWTADTAYLRYAVELDAAMAGAVLLRWTIAPRTFAGDIQVIDQPYTIRAGVQSVRGMLSLHKPRLWWTHDLGNPDLYTITLEVLYADLVSDRYRFLFGIRRFELRDWIPHLNGVRFLIKGNNYLPGDLRLASMTTERCEQDLNLARDCHINCLRVYAHVDHPAFYHAADAAGILLWQDMPLQGCYSADVLPEARVQAQAMVRLLYNHPGIGIWCMHNEPMFVPDGAAPTLRTRLHTYRTAFGFSWNRDVMDTQLKQIAQREDPQRPVVRSSGELPLPYLRSGTDTHAYFGWYRHHGTLADGNAFFRRFSRRVRFVTEFGAQSFPNVESCTRFMPAEIARLDVAHLEQHHGLQADVLSTWVPWRRASSLAELVEMTQRYQAHLQRFYIDRLRYHKYRPTGGMLAFFFIDPYPAVLWSVIDYWRLPKQSYHALRTAFSPQYAFTLLAPHRYKIAEPIHIPVYVVNDAQHPVYNMQLTIRIRNPAGATAALVKHAVSLGADSLAQEIDRLRLLPPFPGMYRLELDLRGADQDMYQVYEIEVV